VTLALEQEDRTLDALLLALRAASIDVRDVLDYGGRSLQVAFPGDATLYIALDQESADGCILTLLRGDHYVMDHVVAGSVAEIAAYVRRTLEAARKS
jgi:hypothetical protein